MQICQDMDPLCIGSSVDVKSKTGASGGNWIRSTILMDLR